MPSELIKAIDAAVERNVACQASYAEQKALAASYKNQLEYKESEKNIQVSVCLLLIQQYNYLLLLQKYNRMVLGK